MKIFNTLTRAKDNFIPLTSKEVKIYACGITPYDTTHLGHAFTYINFDVLIRYLQYKGYKVIYTQNVTDINDRDNDILKRAQEQNVSWQNLSDYWTEKFLGDMKLLNWRAPDNYLYASKEIDKMAVIIKKLLDKKIAYQVKGSIFLDVSQDSNYGDLSGLKREEMLKIANDYEEDIDNPGKKNPLDITLWREALPGQPEHIPSFKSQFGNGRPGWHIECSAMAISSLGEQIDIHGGGKDLIFPHHEAEIVQSQNATGKIPFSKYWMHTGIISYAGEKMSKSLGNLILVSDLLKKVNANSLRYFLISHHYRSDWEFKFEDLEESSRRLADIENALELKNLNGDEIEAYVKQFESFLEDDLNTKQALNLVYELSKKIIAREENSGDLQKTLKKLLFILGFSF